MHVVQAVAAGAALALALALVAVTGACAQGLPLPETLSPEAAVRVLAADWRALQQHGAAQVAETAPAAVRLPLDDGARARRDKEAKDRFELLYQVCVGAAAGWGRWWWCRSLLRVSVCLVCLSLSLTLAHTHTHTHTLSLSLTLPVLKEAWQAAARLQASPPPYVDDLATGHEHVRGDATRALWDTLAAQWRRSYIGTRVRRSAPAPACTVTHDGPTLLQRDWARYIARGAAHLPVSFANVTAALRTQHQALMAALPPADRAGTLAAALRRARAAGLSRVPPSLVPHVGEAAALAFPAVTDAALRRVLDPTQLPTHADVAAVVPWLLPGAPPPPSPPAAVWQEDLADTATPITYTTPLDWVYLMTNPYYKARASRPVGLRGMWALSPCRAVAPGVRAADAGVRGRSGCVPARPCACACHSARGRRRRRPPHPLFAGTSGVRPARRLSFS
jgi:hypothetical protein